MKLAILLSLFMCACAADDAEPGHDPLDFAPALGAYQLDYSCPAQFNAGVTFEVVEASNGSPLVQSTDPRVTGTLFCDATSCRIDVYQAEAAGDCSQLRHGAVYLDGGATGTVTKVCDNHGTLFGCEVTARRLDAGA